MGTELSLPVLWTHYTPFISQLNLKATLFLCPSYVQRSPPPFLLASWAAWTINPALLLSRTLALVHPTTTVQTRLQQLVIDSAGTKKKMQSYSKKNRRTSLETQVKYLMFVLVLHKRLLCEV